MGFAKLFVVFACMARAAAEDDAEHMGILNTAMYCGNVTCYAVIGVPRNASARGIKKAYRKLSMKWHPDRNKGDEQKVEAKARFTEIATAYEVISDEEIRKKYDHYLDHPEDRLFNQYQYYYSFAPKSDWRMVLVGFVIAISCIQYASASQRYTHAHKCLRKDMRVLNRARQILNDRAAAAVVGRSKSKKSGSKKKLKPSREEMEAAIDEVLSTCIDIEGGFGKPSVRSTLAAWIALSPYHIACAVYKQSRWWYLYEFMKKPYTDADKLYLTKSSMGLKDSQWEDMPEEERKEVLERELWVPDNKQAYEDEKMEKFQKKRTGAYKRHVRQKKRAQLQQ